jgi:hypothetical protein
VYQLSDRRFNGESCLTQDEPEGGLISNAE